MTRHLDDPLFSVNAPRTRVRKTSAYVATAVVVAFLVVCWVLPREQPWAMQKLLAVACAGLVGWALWEWTRPRETPEELLYRLRRVQQSDFGKQLLLDRPKPKTVNLPGLGEVGVRWFVVAGAALLALIPWFTPLAPIRVQDTVIEDVTIPFGEEIAAVALVMPNGSIALPSPPVVPPRAGKTARLIRDNADPYWLGLRAVATGQFDEARRQFEAAAVLDVVEPPRVLLAQAQTEMFAAQFQEAAQRYETLIQKHSPEPIVLCQAAVAWFHVGDFVKAEKILAQAQKGLKGKDDPAHAAVLHVHALLAVVQGKDYDKAQNACKAVFDAVPEEARGSDPLTPASQNNQAVLYVLRGQYESAEELFKAARDQWAARQATAMAAAALGNRGILDLLLARYIPGDDKLHQAMNDRLRNRADEQQTSADRLSVAIIDNAAAIYHTVFYQYEDAQQDADSARTLITRELGTEHRSVVPVLMTLARMRFIESRYAQADGHLMHALAVARKAWGPQHPYVASLLLQQAEVKLAQGRLTEAETLAKQAEDIFKTAFNAKHIGVGRAQGIRGQVMLQQDRSRARPLLEQSLGIRREALGLEHPEVAAMLGHLASLDNSPSKYAVGVENYNKALAMATTLLGEDHPAVARLLVGLARLHIERDKLAEAQSALQRALKIQKDKLREFHPEIAVTLELTADVLARLAPPQTEKAAALKAEAQAVRTKHAEVDHAG